MTQFTKSSTTNAAQQDVENFLMIKQPVMQPLHAPLLHHPLIATPPLLEPTSDPTSQLFINWTLCIFSKLRMPYDPVPVWLPKNTKPAQQPQEAQPAQQPQEAQPAQQPQEAQPAQQPQEAQPAQQPQEAQPAQQPQEAQPVYKELLRHSPEEFEQMRQEAAAAAKAAVIKDFDAFVNSTRDLTEMLYDLDIDWLYFHYHRQHPYPIIESFTAFTICVVCGANTYRGVIRVWRANAAFFRAAFPNLPVDLKDPGKARVPSLEGLRKILARLNPAAIVAFIQLLASSRILDDMMRNDAHRPIFALDGKTDRALEYEADAKIKQHRQRHLHKRDYIVTLFSHYGLVPVDQEPVQKKENENKACVRLVSRQDNLQGAIVTSDAGNSVEPVAQAIISAGPDVHCMLPIKGNNPKKEAAAKTAFDEHSNEVLEYRVDDEKGHGRTEVRVVKCLPATVMKPKDLGPWAKIAKTIVLAQTISVEEKYGYERQPETRIFFSSLPFSEPDLAHLVYTAVRAHWGVEAMHYILDVTFKQDRIKHKSRQLHQIRVLINKLALVLLRYEADRSTTPCSIADLRTEGNVPKMLGLLSDVLRGTKSAA